MSAPMYLNGTNSEAGLAGHQLVHTRVVANCDQAGLGRVMVQIPWIDAPVAAQVAALTAGKDRGTFFIPQVGDDVLVLVGNPPDGSTYVIGSLWTSQDTPPRRDPNAAAQVQVIRTPGNHEIELDDAKKSVTITTSGKQMVKLSNDGIVLRVKDDENAASLELKASGEIVIKGNSIRIEVKQTLDLLGGNKAGNVSIDAGGNCTIKGTLVHINDP